MIYFSKESGFTIVETLIVLAVVGTLAVSIIASMSGRIATNREQDGVAQLDSKLRTLVQDVTNGKYSQGNLTCSKDNLGVYSAVNASGTSTFGTGVITNPVDSRDDCVYAGKKISFYDTYYQVDTLATIEGPGVTELTPNTTPIVTNDQVKYTFPAAMKLKNTPIPVSFYIFNANNYNASTLPNFTTGTQNVVFAPNISNPLSSLPSNISLCFYNSNVMSSFAINSNNTITTKLIDSSC